MRHPGEVSWSIGPGIEEVERRAWAAYMERRVNYRAVTDQLWASDWDPPSPHDRRGPVSRAFDAITEYQRNH